MRKVLILGGMTFATLLITFIVWIQFPKVADPQFVQQAVLDGQNTLAGGQVRALDPAKNGYLRKEFLPYWGRKGQEYVENTPVSRVVSSWRDFSTAGMGKFIDHRKLQASKDPAYLKSRAAFEQIAPALEASMRCETFVAPETKFDFDTIVMNYISVRACAQALAGLAESRAAMGRNDSAAGHMASLYSLTRALQGKGPFINEMIACAIAGVADAHTLGLITPTTSLSVESRQDLARNILASIPAKDRMVTLMEGEMSCGVILFKQVRTGGLSSSTYSNLGIPTAGHYIPGFIPREERIHSNTFTRLLKELKATGKVTLTPADNDPTLLDYFSGQAGILTNIMLPSLERMLQRLDMDRARRIAMGAVYSSLAFRAEKGRLPKDLAELTTSFPLPDDSETLGLQYNLSKDKLSIHIPYKEAQEFLDNQKEFPNRPKWVKAENDGLTFHI